MAVDKSEAYELVAYIFKLILIETNRHVWWKLLVLDVLKCLIVAPMDEWGDFSADSLQFDCFQISK